MSRSNPAISRSIQSIHRSLSPRLPSGGRLSARLRRAGVNALPALTVAAVVRDDLDPDGLKDGILPTAATQTDLLVTLPWWEGIEEDYHIQLTWGGVDAGVFHAVTQAELIDQGTIFELLIPAALLTPDATYQLAYRVTPWPDDTDQLGQPRPIRVDTTAPGGEIGTLARIRFSPAVEAANAITLADLPAGVLSASVPGFIYQETGDVIQPMMTGGNLGTKATVLGDASFTPITFSRATLETLEDGEEIDFFYTVTDRAGNVSHESYHRSLKVYLQESPIDILPPLVPAFDDGLVTEADARGEVVVQVPPYTNAKVGDEIVVIWGTQRSVPETLVADDLDEDPLVEIVLSYLLVQTAGDGTIAVSYEINRNKITLGVSEALDVEVDLTLPGGPDPDTDTPWHDHLQPALVKGGVTDQNNIIEPEDLEVDALITIAWLGVDAGEPPVPGLPVMLLGDQIHLAWGTQAPTEIGSVTEDNIEEEDPLELVFPAALMQAEGSGAVEVYYTITRKLTAPGFENSARSPVTVVTVTDAGDFPGGGRPILPPEFTNLNSNGAVGTEQAKIDLPVRANTYINMAVGDIVTLHFSGDNSVSGTPGIVIPAAAYTSLPRTVGQQDITNRYVEFLIPRRYAYLICRGSATPYFKVTNANGKIVNSDAARVPVAVRLAGATTCPVPP